MPAPRPRGRWLRRGAIGGLGLVALAVVAARLGGEPARATAAAPAPAPMGLPMPMHSPDAANAAPAAAEAVRWDGEALAVDIDDMPLPQAVALLAQATRTAVHGLERLQQPAPVTLHWRSTEPIAMWQRVLQPRAAFSVDCSAAACRLWITGDLAVQQPAPQPAWPSAPPPAPAPTTAPGRPPQTAAEREEAESQPGGSC